MDLRGQFRQELEKGRQYLGLEVGIVSKTCNERYEVFAGLTQLPFFKEGDVFNLAETYCSEVVRTHQTIFYNQVGLIGEMRFHPIYRSLQLESYIGTPIMIEGKLWGTLNFSSIQAKEIHFSEQEVAYIENASIQLATKLENTPH
jgi:GAF domain-containing protein